MEGYIKLYRKIMDNELWHELRRFSRAEAWIDMLLRANHKDTKITVGYDIFHLKAGQFITSQIKLAETWNWNRETVKVFLDYLQSSNNIGYKTSNKNTVITIINWGIYQNHPSDNPATNPARKRQQLQHHSGTDNNDKNVKNYILIYKETKFTYLKNKDFLKTFDEFLEMRRKIRKAATNRAQELMLEELHKYDIETAIEMLEQSIINSWQGIFPLKQGGNCGRDKRYSQQNSKSKYSNLSETVL